jgi:hypothetical protein
MGTAITPIVKNVTQFVLLGVQIDTVQHIVNIFVSRQDASGNQYDTQTVIVTGPQFDAAWNGTINGTLIAIAAASPKVTT